MQNNQLPTRTLLCTQSDLETSDLKGRSISSKQTSKQVRIEEGIISLTHLAWAYHNSESAPQRNISHVILLAALFFAFVIECSKMTETSRTIDCCETPEMTWGQGLHVVTLYTDDLLLRPFPVPQQLKALWILHSNSSLESAQSVPAGESIRFTSTATHVFITSVTLLIQQTRNQPRLPDGRCISIHSTKSLKLTPGTPSCKFLHPGMLTHDHWSPTATVLKPNLNWSLQVLQYRGNHGLVRRINSKLKYKVSSSY